MIYDSHFHLDLMPNMMDLVSEAKLAGIGLFAVGTTPKAYDKVYQLCASIANIHVGLGLHPQLISSGYDDMSLFEKILPSTRYIGEIGLDYSNNYIHLKAKQLEVFEHIVSQCEFYGNKIASVHSLRSVSDVLNIIQKYKATNETRYLLHWYTGTKSQLLKAIDLGCYFSINPKMLKTKSGIETIKTLPFERILLETDAPFTKHYVSINSLENELIELVNQISIIKGKDVSTFLSENEKMIYTYH